MFAPKKPKRCQPSAFAIMFRREGRMPLYHLIFGLESKIPICCILAFCARHIFMWDSTSPCYGVHSCRAEYSHCWFHRRTEHNHAVPEKMPTFPLYRALLSIMLCVISLTAQTVTADFASRSGGTTIPAGFVAVGGMNNLAAAPLSLMVNAGLDRTRMFLSLDTIYKTGTANFASADTLLARMQTAGVRGLGVLVGTPPSLGVTYCTPPDPAKWTALAVAVVTHIDAKFPGVLDRYEVWNEPDSTASMCPATGVDALSSYLGIYAAAAPAIRALGHKVGGPTLAIPSRNTGWITSLVTNPATAPYVDFVSYHVYLTGQTDITNGMTWTQLYGYTQAANSGLAHYYTLVAPLVRAGKQPDAATTPIYLTEYNDNWAFAVDCCRNDPTYGPLWNALAIVDHLNAGYTAKSVPSQLVYFNSTSSKYFCVLGLVDTAMDCAAGSDPYPQFYALKLFAGTLGLHDGGNLAGSVSATGVVATAFYTKDADTVVLINPTSPAVTVTLTLNHPGFVSAAATSYLLAGGSITSAPLVLQSSGSNYTAQVSLPAYSTLAISVTGSTQIALPPGGLKADVS